MNFKAIKAKSKQPVAEFLTKDLAEMFIEMYNDGVSEEIIFNLHEDKNYSYTKEPEKHPDFYLDKPNNAWEEFIDGLILIEIKK